MFRIEKKGDSPNTCMVAQLGLIEYTKAYKIQKRLHRKRMKGEIPDTLLLLEHPPTLTIGKSGSIENILVSKEKLADEGIALFSIERGGDVTYHGPGQLVGYPIMDLSSRGKDIRRYVRDIEEVLIRTLKDFSISASRDENHAGVWVENDEIAAIGLSVRNWVTMHGFVLNINPNLEHFNYINPCGFSDRRATSMAELLGHEVSMEGAANRLIDNLSVLFPARIEEGLHEVLKSADEEVNYIRAINASSLVNESFWIFH